MLTVAKGMTRQGVRYHRHTAEWNKNMVKRILENTKYTGADGYPKLVAEEDFAAVQRQKTERNTYVPLAAEIRPIQHKTVCARCGGRTMREPRSHGRVGWRCQDLDCGQVVRISDEALAKQVDGRLRELAQAPQLLTAPELRQAGVDMDAVRLQNELTLVLNRGSEKPEYLKALAFAVAIQRYGQFPDPTPAHELERLQARLKQDPADANTLADLLRTAVRTVRLTPNKNVELELINGTIIAETEVQSA